jgi:hypothetical protein
LEESPAGLWRACFRIGEVSLGLNGDSIKPAFGAQIDLFRSELTPCDIEINLKWTERLSQLIGQPLFDSGSVWKVYEDGDGLTFDFASPAISPEPYKRLHVDREFRQGCVLLNQNCFPDPATCNPLEYPLDELVVMHRLGRERGVEVHAAGLRDSDGTGYLFLGHSGAGKSTTTRLWNQQHSMTVLSDDRIILRETDGEIWMHGTPWHGEAAFAAPDKAQIDRLFILEHAPDSALANRITPVRGGQAVGEIMARSFLPFYDAAALENTMSFLQEIVAAIPCYRLEFRPDGSAVEAVRQFRS